MDGRLDVVVSKHENHNKQQFWEKEATIVCAPVAVHVHALRYSSHVQLVRHGTSLSDGSCYDEP